MVDGFVYNVLTGKANIRKDPDSILNYTYDWTDWLAAAGGASIADYTFTIDDRMTKVADSIDGALITIRLAGGGDVWRYGMSRPEAICEITTGDGQKEDCTFVFEIMQK